MKNVCLLVLGMKRFNDDEMYNEGFCLDILQSMMMSASLGYFTPTSSASVQKKGRRGEFLCNLFCCKFFSLVKTFRG